MKSTVSSRIKQKETVAYVPVPVSVAFCMVVEKKKKAGPLDLILNFDGTIQRDPIDAAMADFVNGHKLRTHPKRVDHGEYGFGEQRPVCVALVSAVLVGKSD